MVTFTPTVTQINDGQDVKALIVNKPLGDLDQRTLWLREQVRNIQSAYRVISVPNVPVTDDVVDWNAVYWNPSGSHNESPLGAFSPAVAEVIWDGANFVPGDRNYVAGVVGTVTGTVGLRRATLYLHGLIEQVASQGLLKSGQTLVYGKPVYLTTDATAAGKGEITQPTIEVQLGKYVPEGLLVNPYIRNLGETHLHYKFDLSDNTEWSGTGPWLYPAANLQPYPPIPFESAVLLVNGLYYSYGTSADFYLDATGVILTNSTYPPAATNWDVFLHYIIPKSLTGAGVTTLTPGNDIIQIQSCTPGGLPDVGDLKISAVNVIDEVTAVSSRTLVVKKIETNASTGHLEVDTGPYVQKLVAGPGVALSPVGGTGEVTVSVVSADQINKRIIDIALNNAKERIEGLTSFIGFPKTITTEILCKEKLPEGVNQGVELKIYCDYLGVVSAAGTGTFNILYRITDLDGNVTGSGVATTGNLIFPDGYSAYTRKYAQLFSIPGSALFSSGILSFSVERDITDTYSDEVGILVLEAVVTVQ